MSSQEKKIIYFLWRFLLIVITASLVQTTIRIARYKSLDGNNYVVTPLIPNIVDHTDYNFSWLLTTAKQIRAFNIEVEAAHKAVEDYRKLTKVDGSWDYKRSTPEQRKTIEMLQKREMDLSVKLQDLIAKYNFHNVYSILPTFVWDGSAAIEQQGK